MLAVRTVNEVFFSETNAPPDRRFRRAYEMADQSIYERSRRDGEEIQMGTTCTALAIIGDAYWVAHVGDSRAYHVTPAAVLKLTTDHTFVSQLVRDGIISEQQAQNDSRRHSLTQALGIGAPFTPEIFSMPEPNRGDRIILCSDGLGEITADEIGSISRTNDVESSCRIFVELANERGGADNSTVIALEILR